MLLNILQGSPHPPPKGGSRSVMGNYRTTMFRRDFNRLQAQRNQGFPKAPVPVTQGAVESEQGNPQKPETKLDPQNLTTANGAASSSLEEGGVDNLHLDQRSELSNSERPVDQVFFLFGFRSWNSIQWVRSVLKTV